jgi:hypothetical protein
MNVSLICLSYERISCFLAETFGHEKKYDFVSFFELIIYNKKMSMKIYFHGQSQNFDHLLVKENVNSPGRSNQTIYLVNININSGIEFIIIGQFINTLQSNITHFFCSDDLKENYPLDDASDNKSRGVMNYLINGISSEKINYPKVSYGNSQKITIPLIILPCAHKVRYRYRFGNYFLTKKNCDAMQFGQQNMSDCFRNNKKLGIKEPLDCNILITQTLDKVIVEFITDSSFYSAFYDGNRKTREGNQTRFRCRDTNFLKQIEYIQSVENEDLPNKLEKYRSRNISRNISRTLGGKSRNKRYRKSSKLT